MGLLLLSGCARPNVPLGTEGADNGGDNAGNGSAADDDAGDPRVPDSSANTGDSQGDGGGNSMLPIDSGSTVMCLAATCASAVELGEIDASNPEAVLTHSGHGSTFLRLSAADTNFGGLGGPSATSGSIGIAATVTATAAGKFEVYVRGELAKAGDACVENSTDLGSDGMTTAIWNGEGPNPSLKPARLLTIEIKQTEGTCEGWTLTLTGMPCMIPFPPLPASCP